MTAISHNAPTSFDNAWPKAPFAELIRLALSIAGLVVKQRARLTTPAPVGPRQHA